MVRQDHERRLHLLERLQEEKEKTEEELQQLEEEKKEELENIEDQLENLIVELMETEEEIILSREEDEETEEDESDESEEEPESLEETIQTQRSQQQRREGGPVYEMNTSEVEEMVQNLGDVYDNVRQAVEGEADEFHVDRARQMIYELTNAPAEAQQFSDEAQQAIAEDQEDQQYMQRLNTLIETFEQGTEKGMYQSNNNQPDHT